jgi:hypothetical protein
LCFVITTQCLCWPLSVNFTKKKKVKTKPFLFVPSIPFGWMIVKSKLVKHFISDRDTKKLQQQHTSNIVYAIIWKIQTKFLKIFVQKKVNKAEKNYKFFAKTFRTNIKRIFWLKHLVCDVNSECKSLGIFEFVCFV